MRRLVGFLPLYERGAERGDPYEEGIKLTLRSGHVSPWFLSRSSIPDGELMGLALQGKLLDSEVMQLSERESSTPAR